jgi:NFU1 iron-sulfur cluster scaffold homolog, mitochondrial
MTIYTEVTPNPASLKFVTDQILLPSGTADFPDAASAQEVSVLAATLFKSAHVGGVFIGRNFVTVSKVEGARWEDVIPFVKEELRKLIESGVALVAHVTEAPSSFGDEVTERIKALIDEQVRPAVAMDGGDIVFEGFDEGVVKLKLKGSCSGCPSSSMTLKAGIQGLLMRMVPEVKSVEAV